MKRIHVAILVFCCLLRCSALDEPQGQLRGLVNLPNFQGAICEILNITNNSPIRPKGPPNVSRISNLGLRLVGEDIMHSGAGLDLILLKVDPASDTVEARLGGKERTFRFPLESHPTTATSSIHLQNATFSDLLDLYSKWAGRTILLHPQVVDRSAVSIEVRWTNTVPDNAEITDVFSKFLGKSGAVALEDGDRFLQIIPSRMSKTASLHAKDLPAEKRDVVFGFGGISLSNLVGVYVGLMEPPGQKVASESVRSRASFQLNLGQNLTLRTVRPISKPEGRYALETLFRWHGYVFQVEPDGGIWVEPVRRQP